MKITSLIVTAILGMAVAGALAQQGPPQGQQGGNQGRGPGGQGRGGFRGGDRQLMQALDLNSDGELDAREIQSAPISLRKLDTNNDFKLSADELGTRRGRGNVADRMLEMDANKDGKLTSDEVPERMQRFIERMDTNGDGSVDKSEMEAFQQQMQQRFQDGGGRGNQGGPPED